VEPQKVKLCTITTSPTYTLSILRTKCNAEVPDFNAAVKNGMYGESDADIAPSN